MALAVALPRDRAAGENASRGHARLSDGSDDHPINAPDQVPPLELDNGTRVREGPAPDRSQLADREGPAGGRALRTKHAQKEAYQAPKCL